MKSRISSFLRIFVSLGLLGLLFWLMRDDISGIGKTIFRAKPWHLVIGLVLLLINVFILAYRMKIIFEGENIRMGFWESTQLTYIGYFFNNFMPTAVGGDIVKAHYASLMNRKKVQSFASVLMDRFIGLYSFLIVAAVALVVDRGRLGISAVTPLVLSLLALGLAGFAVVTNTRIAGWVETALSKLKMLSLGEKIHAVYKIVHDYRNRTDVVGRSLAASIIGQAVYFIVVYLFFGSLGYNVSIGNIFLIMPIVTFISMLPSIGGLGVREGATMAFFAPLVGKEIAFAGSLLLLFGLFFLSFIGGAIYLWWALSGVVKTGEIKEEDPFAEAL
jgi:hypothetical protein